MLSTAEPIEKSCAPGCLETRTVKLGDSPVSIGRASDRVGERAANSSNLYLTNSHISKEHARLLVQNNQVFVEDLNSSFGTVKNNDLLIPFNRIPLKEGDLLGFVLNRSFSYILSIRNLKSVLKFVLLALFLSPKIQVQFKVTTLDLNAGIIVFESVGHSCNGELSAGSSDRDSDKNEHRLSSNVSFSYLLNSESGESTTVSDFNEHQSVSEDQNMLNQVEFGETDSEQDSVLTGSGFGSSNETSDEEPEIVVNLGPDPSIGKARTPVDSSNDKSGETAPEAANFSPPQAEDLMLCIEDTEDENLIYLSDGSVHSEELSEEELSDEILSDDVSEDEIGVGVSEELEADYVIDQAIWESMEQVVGGERSPNASKAPVSRKRTYEAFEVASSEDAQEPPAKKTSKGVLWEIGKGAMYVTGTLMAMVAYGGYLENAK